MSSFDDDVAEALAAARERPADHRQVCALAVTLLETSGLEAEDERAAAIANVLRAADVF